MKLTISRVRRAGNDEWDEIWRACSYATYFHSREWAETWRDYSRGNVFPDPRLICFSDGTRALLPFSAVRRHRGLVTEYMTSPAGTFGGWISQDAVEAPHAALLTHYLTRRLTRLRGNLVWRINPYGDQPDGGANWGWHRVPGQTPDQTQVLELSPGFDVIFKGWSKGHRAAARQAQKAGITVKEAETGDHWDSYYALYEDSLRRWGKGNDAGYGPGLFRIMREKKSAHIRLWGAYHRGRMVAGALCFYARTHVVYWHGAALGEYFSLKPVNLLLHEIIKDSCEKGFRWFDFNPSGGHEGVRKFKKSFGTREIDCPLISLTCPMDRLFSWLSNLKGFSK